MKFLKTCIARMPEVVLGLSLIYGFLLRFSLVSGPYMDGDSSGYLSPAINFYDDRTFAMVYGRSYPYPVFLGIILILTKSIASITTVQHLLGLVTGCLLARCFWMLAHMFPATGGTPFFLRLFGAFSAALYLLSPTAIHYEHYVRTEALNPLVVTFALYLQLKVFQSFFREEQPRLCQWVVLSVFFNVFSYYFRPNLGFAILLSMALGLVVLWTARVSKVRIAASVVAAFLLSALLIWLPQRYASRDDVMRTIFLSKALIACHAHLISPVVTEDWLAKDFSLVDEERLRLLQAGLAEETARYAPGSQAPGRYAVLGLNPDSVMYQNMNIYKYSISFDTPQQFVEANYAYFLRFLRRRSLSYIDKVVDQVRVVYGSLGQGIFYPEVVVDQRALMASTRPRLTGVDLVHRRNEKNETLVKEYFDKLTVDLEKLGKPDPSSLSINQLGWIKESTKYLNTSYRFLMIALPLGLALLYLATYFLRIPDSPQLRLLRICGGAAMFLLAYNFLHTLSVSMVGSIEIGRYVQAQYISCVAFVGVAFAFICGVIQLCIIKGMSLFSRGESAIFSNCNADLRNGA